MDNELLIDELKDWLSSQNNGKKNKKKPVE